MSFSALSSTEFKITSLGNDNWYFSKDQSHELFAVGNKKLTNALMFKQVNKKNFLISITADSSTEASDDLQFFNNQSRLYPAPDMPPGFQLEKL